MTITSEPPVQTGLAWTETTSRLHTHSSAQADAWRAIGLDVVTITDTGELLAALEDPRIVWA